MYAHRQANHLHHITGPNLKSQLFAVELTFNDIGNYWSHKNYFVHEALLQLLIVKGNRKSHKQDYQR